MAFPFKSAPSTKSLAAEPDADDAPVSAPIGAPRSTPPAFSKFQFGKGRKRKPGKVAPAQKALMNPAGRSMGGGGR